MPLPVQSSGVPTGPAGDRTFSESREEQPVADLAKSLPTPNPLGAAEKYGWKFLRDKKPSLTSMDKSPSAPSIPALAVQLKRLAVLEVKLAARLRRRCFAHHDCVSVLSNLADSTGVSKASFNVNLKSGASAILEGEEDGGDGKSNALVRSTAQFRNELGDEPCKVGELESLGAGGRLQFRPVSCVGVLMEDYTVASMDDEEKKRYRFSQLGLCRPQGAHQNKDKQISRFNHMDLGVLYYRKFFVGHDHQNFFGVDEGLGPVAVSIKREQQAKKSCQDDGKVSSTFYTAGSISSGPRNIYRVIVRTAHPNVLRGSVSEESIMTACNKKAPPGSLSPKEIISFVAPELHLASLRVAVASSKATEQLLKLDESNLAQQFKIGVMYCMDGQASEEDMYNNDTASPAFHDFMSCVAEKVTLKGFEKYRAQLDNKSDSTGTHSYYTSFEGTEIMFHVSTMLPSTPNNRQQLLRKRHIGNDIVTLIFQEKGAHPFTPATIRSHFQHVFVVVQCLEPCPNTGKMRYQVATSQAESVPVYGPAVPDGGVFEQGSELREFLLTKLINAECASRDCVKFMNMCQRTRFEYLSDLAENYVTQQSVDSSDSSGFYGKLARMRRKTDKPGERITTGWMSASDLASLPGALVWSVRVVNWGIGNETHQIECFLCISLKHICLVDEELQIVRLEIPSDMIIGWLIDGIRLRIYYGQGAYITLCISDTEEQQGDCLFEIQARLTAAAPNGCDAMPVHLERSAGGHLGFTIHRGGIVGEVDENGVAYSVGIRQGFRIVEMDGIPMYGFLHYYVVGHLKKSNSIDAIVIKPHSDGSPRGGKTSLQSDRIRHKSEILRKSRYNGRSMSSRFPSRSRLPLESSARRARLSVVSVSDRDKEEFRHIAQRAKMALGDSLVTSPEKKEKSEPSPAPPPTPLHAPEPLSGEESEA